GADGLTARSEPLRVVLLHERLIAGAIEIALGLGSCHPERLRRARERVGQRRGLGIDAPRELGQSLGTELEGELAVVFVFLRRLGEAHLATRSSESLAAAGPRLCLTRGRATGARALVTPGSRARERDEDDHGGASHR